ncbi:hypothetical protein I350_01683 [Cryptococcus amylolentus CBS 6273]|uniref:Major facilitator superfamily (MFS) profile domain-containing protein n=1 Tax=Cryptococcus amylolentus CBS 6273 TaxID=1296118 RepID=A0A1E3KDA6_9TREE|nr:hypothetical protein I350_01683 [Cryptococcus amylolentus CBS 6273]
MSRDPLALGQEIGSPSSLSSALPTQHTNLSHSQATNTSTLQTDSTPNTVPNPTTSRIPANLPHDQVTSGDFAPSSQNARAGGSDHDESPTPTLAGPNSGHGTHGYDPVKNDDQYGSVGGKAGAGVAGLGAAEVGTDYEKTKEIDEKGENPAPLARDHRTASGTAHAQPAPTTSDAKTVEGLGMVSLSRQFSTPPAVSPFGGVAPSGIDAERGLRAMRSREEEEARDLERETKGPDPFAVQFEPGEDINPKNWGVGYRWWLTCLSGLLVLNSTFASSSPSGIIKDMMAYFGFSQEVAILTLSLFVAGYCVGPIVWGPLSETYGRRPVFIATFIVYTGFQVGCALSKNTASILIFRFLGGTFAAAPLTNSGAMLADIWDGDHRGKAMSCFALAPFAGPSVGPIVSGFIQVTGTSWRWMFWILTIFAGVCLAVIVFFVPETYSPKILAKKAARLRKETGDDRYYAPLERADASFKARVHDILFKPFIILALEPMLQAVTMYMSFVYGVVYLLFEAFPFVFEQNHGFNAGEEGLAFLGFFSGGCAAVIFFVTVIEPRFLRHAKAVAPEAPRPEMRLELCVISGISLVIALFWFGWTSYSSIHWISPVLAGAFIGVGTLGMFVSLFNYIIDVYLWSAASALAAATVIRSLFGAAFPLFATQMYDKLGTQWASSLLGFLALLMAPIPIILMKYGHHLRAKSKFSPSR